jgi:dynein heavy chain, axonemal
LIKKEVSSFGNTKMIKFCRRQLRYGNDFTLFITTNLSAPKLDANITNHVQVVNFAVSVEQLTQNILSIVVASERPDLEQNFLENTKDTFDNIKILRDNEEQIVKLLYGDGKTLLKDDSLVNTLKESTHAAEVVAAKLKRIFHTNEALRK